MLVVFNILCAATALAQWQAVSTGYPFNDHFVFARNSKVTITIHFFKWRKS